MRLRSLALVLLSSLSLGCAPCCSVAGDPSQPMQLSLLVANADRVYTPVPDGGQASIIFGGQGSPMIAVTARALNADLCGATVHGRLVDVDAGTVLADTENVFDLLDGTPPAPATVPMTEVEVANYLQPCFGNQAFLDRPARLELEVTDSAGHTGSVSQLVVPTCPDNDSGSYCRRRCSPEQTDGGTP